MAEDVKSQEEARIEEARRQIIKDRLLRVLLTSEARRRLTNIKMVKPELANVVEEYIIQLASSGKIKEPLTDEEFKQLLMVIQKPKKDFKIRWA
ncbi:MAG: DNA-binding protein [archaeon]|nr:DNA-binding protein [archaeon]